MKRTVTHVMTKEVVVTKDTIPRREILSALDANVPLLPRTRCPDVFTIRFRLRDGRAEEFGYPCDPQPSFLRGNQSFWDRTEIKPPELVDRLVQEQIAPRCTISDPQRRWRPSGARS